MHKRNPFLSIKKNMTKKGRSLENLLTKVNISYRRNKLALVQYLETPIVLTTKGLVAKQSTVDFIGVMKDGTGIAFDAKSTENKTSIPLSNFKEHQIEFLRLFEELGGMSFFLIHFAHHHKYKYGFITPASFVAKYWDDARQGVGRKSIPYTDFNQEWLVELDDYLKLKPIDN